VCRFENDLRERVPKAGNANKSDVVQLLGALCEINLPLPRDTPPMWRDLGARDEGTDDAVTFALRTAPHLIDRPVGHRDSRTQWLGGFKPDTWQQLLLDAIDEDKSVFVHAPTSAGKTFVCYYAMHKALEAWSTASIGGSTRGSIPPPSRDAGSRSAALRKRDGVTDLVAYICPTEPLAEQVFFEARARFGENGIAIWSKRDLIGDVDTCKVLVCTIGTFDTRVV
jgi:hypothetical protein